MDVFKVLMIRDKKHRLTRI